MISSPCYSPLVLENNRSFISLKPALNGFIRTFKYLQDDMNEKNEENCECENEEENDISINLLNLKINTNKYTVKLLETISRSI